MKAIMVMYDSLRFDMLKCFGGEVDTPNFDRLAKHTVRFEKNYVGSLPCMPARRELQTGRYNFLHRSWGPMEPFDDSMPEILKKNGIHTHLSTDHYHYMEDGGATYHERFNTYELHRGQENDGWMADLSPKESEFAPNQVGTEYFFEAIRQTKKVGGWQNEANREVLKSEKDYPMHLTFDNGLQFLEKNHMYDNWFLQIETFDPHEPFTSPDQYNSQFFSPDEGFVPDWPPYATVHEEEKLIEGIRKKYKALLTFCDAQLGRLLDKMDEYHLWDDTMLIVNTDHGFFLAEYGYWGKGNTPNYEILVHTPLFIWDPRCQKKDEVRHSLTQTIDLAPTILRYFGLEIPRDMLGKDLKDTIAKDTSVHETVIFGYHGCPVGITDGKYVLLRAVQDMEAPLYEYTFMPTHMRGFFTLEELKTAQMHEGFSFTKGCPIMQIKTNGNPFFMKSQEVGKDELYDLEKDPHQKTPLDLPEVKERLLKEMARHFKENEAPEEMYQRFGLEKL